ncbi:MAG: glycine cleavage system aminomethyltransferase GcvT, partial [Desulfitobacterium hafniense]
MTELKRTPLYEQHRRAGAKLIDFGGWEMPVQYAGVIEEHKAVRS